VPVHYLLECSCGKEIPVTASQAGQSIRCSCGQELEVPTLLKLKRLKTVEDEPSVLAKESGTGSTGNWGVAQGLVTVGVLITLLAVGWLVFVVLNKPPAPKERVSDQAIERSIQNMNLVKTYYLWNRNLRQDIRVKMGIDVQYLAALKAYHIRLGIAVVLVVVGFGLTILTFFCTRQTASRT